MLKSKKSKIPLPFSERERDIHLCALYCISFSALQSMEQFLGLPLKSWNYQCLFCEEELEYATSFNKNTTETALITFFKGRILTIFRRLIILSNHTHFKITRCIKVFQFFSLRGHLHSSVWASRLHWHISTHKILQDPLTSSYMCIAKRKARIQFHLG